MKKEYREWLDRMVPLLKEMDDAEEVTGEALEIAIAHANERRAARGIPPLVRREEWPPPEAGLHERAKRLGLIRKSS